MNLFQLFVPMVAEGIATSLADILAMVGTILTAIGGWVVTIVGMVVSTPLFLISFAVGLSFVGLKWYHRLRG